MHSLLKRQIKRHFGEKFNIPEEWRSFVNSINDAYSEFDEDRVMLERSLDLSSQELLQANSEMRAVFQAIPDLLFRLDRDGTILDIKAGTGGEFMLQRQSFSGKRIQDIPIEAVSKQFHEAIARVAKEKCPVSIEYALPMQGQECLYEARFVPLFENQVVAIVRNITERKQAAEAIAQERQLLRTLIDLLPETFYVKDLDCRFLVANKALAKHLGKETPSQILGLSDADFFPAESAAKFRVEELKVLGGEPLIDHEGISPGPAGQKCTHLTTKVPFRDSQGRIRGLVGIGRDITERKQAAETIAHERQLLRTLIDLLPETFYIKDLDSRFLVANETLAKRFGKETPDQVLGLSDADLFPPDLAAEFRADEEQVFSGGSIINKEHSLVFPDGRKYTLLTTKVPFRDGEGQIQGLVGIGRDITERKQAEEIIAHERQLLRTLIDLLPEIFYIKDLDGRFLVANEALAKHFGKATPSQLLGLSDADFYPAGLAAKFRAEEMKVFGGQPLIDQEEKSVSPSGREGAFLTTKVPFRDSQGRIQGLVGIGRDISERKETLLKLEHSLSLLQSTLESTADGLLVVNLAGQIATFNKRFGTLWHIPQALLEARDDAPVLAMVTAQLKDPEAFLLRVRELYKDTTAESFDVLECKDGRVFERYSCPQWLDGAPVGRVWSFRDVTKHRELEAQLRQVQKMEAFGQLAAGVAHDFNNILTVIHGNLSLLQMGTFTEAETRQAIDYAIQAAERAANLTRQLLTFSRRQLLQPKDLDLNVVVANMTKMLQRLIGEHIAMETRFAPGGAPVHADPDMMAQVLMNLAVNSRDAMPNGGQLMLQTATVVVGKDQTQSKSNAPPGEYICLSVSDTGSGIAPVHLPHIFEPFFTTKDVGQGTGLGLATVFGIVEQHNGWIDVESQVNTGTIFRIYLPRLANGMTALAEPQASAPARRGTETILLVEDEVAVRRLMRTMLERHGYRVYEAVSGVDALQLWQEHRAAIELLITDMVMPGGISGRELSERLQSEKPGLKIIQCSGYSIETSVKDSQLLNNLYFLEKPFDPRKFLQRVRDNLDGR